MDEHFRMAEQIKNKIAKRIMRLNEERRRNEQKRNTERRRLARQNEETRRNEQKRDTERRRLARQDEKRRRNVQQSNSIAHGDITYKSSEQVSIKSEPIDSEFSHNSMTSDIYHSSFDHKINSSICTYSFCKTIDVKYEMNDIIDEFKPTIKSEPIDSIYDSEFPHSSITNDIYHSSFDHSNNSSMCTYGFCKTIDVKYEMNDVIDEFKPTIKSEPIDPSYDSEFSCNSMTSDIYHSSFDHSNNSSICTYGFCKTVDVKYKIDDTIDKYKPTNSSLINSMCAYEFCKTVDIKSEIVDTVDEYISTNY